MDSCAISVYKLSRNKGVLFLFFGFLAGAKVWFLIRFTAAASALCSCYCSEVATLCGTLLRRSRYGYESWTSSQSKVGTVSRAVKLLFKFCGFLAGQDVVSYPIHRTKKPTGCRLLL